MSFRLLNPYVRYAMITTRETSYAETLYAYDYRLFYVLENKCSVELMDKTVELTPCDVLILPPAQGYRLLFEQGAPCRFVLLNFDLDNVFYGSMPYAPDVFAKFNAEKLFSPLRLTPFQTLFQLRDMPLLREALLRICDIAEKEPPYFADIISAVLKEVLLQCAALQQNGEEKRSELAERLRVYLDAHFLEAPSNDEIAAQFRYHSFYLNKLFTKQFGKTIHAYINSKKIRFAQQLLLSTDKSIAEIASEVGFSGAAWFSEYFKANTGVCPSYFRRHGR